MAVDKSKTIDMSGNDIICRNILTASSLVGNSGFKQLWGNGNAPLSSTSTSLTVTIANMLTGIVISNGAGAVTATLDTAANIVAGVNSASAGAVVGDIVAFELSANTSAVTVAAGTGGTFDANVVTAAKTIAAAGAKTVFARLTNVTPGSEAYVIYM